MHRKTIRNLSAQHFYANPGGNAQIMCAYVTQNACLCEPMRTAKQNRNTRQVMILEDSSIFITESPSRCGLGSCAYATQRSKLMWLCEQSCKGHAGHASCAAGNVADQRKPKHAALPPVANATGDANVYAAQQHRRLCNSHRIPQKRDHRCTRRSRCGRVQQGVGVLTQTAPPPDSALRGNFYGLNFLDTPLWPNGFGLPAEYVAAQQFASFTTARSRGWPFRTLLYPA
jgi:hypothetical protein